jgi:3-methyladenine DNA glycosylase AlkD
MDTIINEFIKLGKPALIDSFKRHWAKVYSEDTPRAFTKELEVDLGKAYDTMVEIAFNTEKIDASEQYVVKGNWFIDDSSIENYLRVWGEDTNLDINRTESWMTYSMMGTDWNTQLFWLLDMDNIDQSNCMGEPYTKEDVLGLILFELTFFGCSPKAIEARMNTTEDIDWDQYEKE